MFKRFKSNQPKPEVEYPYVAVQFLCDETYTWSRNYTYRNIHPDIEVGDFVKVGTGLIYLFKKRAIVRELLKESPYKGRHKTVGKIVNTAKQRREEITKASKSNKVIKFR